MTIRTRFAPSPTGYLHIGGARTALFSWLHARKHGGRFVLRIEDTDLERSSKESVNAILEGMSWLGLDYDEGPFSQMERMDRYQEVIQRLLAEGKAYHCYCSRERLDELWIKQMAAKQKPRYDGHCERHEGPPPEGASPVIRFRNPKHGKVIVEDMIRGKVVFDNAELDDLIIARSDGTPTYNLCVVVDDHDMGVSHVIRGDDHLNNTPRQINILDALGAAPPIYAHVPMILGEDGKRLSKRHGAVSVMQYKEDGFLPEALLNYLIRLGWSHGDQEIFSLDEMIELFDIETVNNAAAAFNPEKLLWLNQQYIKNLPPEHVARYLLEHLGRLDIDPATGPAVSDIVVALRERASTLVDMAEGSVYFYRDFEDYDEKAAKKNLRPVSAAPLMAVREALANLDDWSATALHQVVVDVAASLDLKMGKIAQPLRVAISGRAATPGIDVTLQLIGRDSVLRRIDRALDYIRQRSEGEEQV